MAWQQRTGRTGLYYDQYGYKWYWEWLEPEGEAWCFENCMANCTVYAIGRQYEAGRPKPVTVMKNANKWHQYVNTAEGWKLLEYYDGMPLVAGDILEWTSPANHVAVCETSGTDPIISGSWWTDNDGGSKRESRQRYDNMGSTMADVSEFFKSYYTNRFWHNNRKIYTEAGLLYNIWPTYVLRYEGEEPSPTPTPTPTPTYDSVDVAIYATINKRRNKRNVKIIL